MRGAQVAVALDHAPGGEARVEEGGVALERFLDEGAGCRGVLGPPGVADEAGGLAVLARPPGALGGRACEVGVVLHDGGGLVEGDQPPREPLGEVRGRRARREQPVERARVGQAAHLYGVLDDLARGRVALDNVVAAGHPHDRDDAEVDAGREAAVETQFGVAEALARLRVELVDEAEVDRLLRLVDHVTGEEDPGDVRLAQLDPRRARAGRPRGRAGPGRTPGSPRPRSWRRLFQTAPTRRDRGAPCGAGPRRSRAAHRSGRCPSRWRR